MATAGNDGIEQLAKKAGQGDRTAFSQIVRQMMSKVSALTYRMTGDREAAKDLAQDSFVSAWENLPNFRGESGFTGWLYKIAANKCLNYLSRASTKQNVSFEESNTDSLTSDRSAGNPEKTLVTKTLREDILEFMQTLPGMQRAVFELRFYQGMSFGEISRQLNKAEGTVKTHYRQAVIKLRKTAMAKGWIS